MQFNNHVADKKPFIRAENQRTSNERFNKDIDFCNMDESKFILFGSDRRGYE